MGYYEKKILAVEYIEKNLDLKKTLLEIELSVLREYGFGKRFIHAYLNDIQHLRKDFSFDGITIAYKEGGFDV